jgi:branched-chain amino acid aminotransferase
MSSCEVALVWPDGRWQPATEVSVSVYDLGFLRGMGVFDTLRSYGGHPFALGAHLQRLWRSAETLGLEPLFSEKELRNRITTGRQLAGANEFKLRIVVTPGRMGEGFAAIGEPTVVLMLAPLVPPPEHRYLQGVSVVTVDARRELPEHKTTNYLVGQRGLALARARGAHEALYADSGRVTEGITSNVVLRFDDVLVTPGRHRLPGITLATLQGVATGLGLHWEARDVDVAELAAADAVYLTSSLREILPVVRVNGQVVSGGKPDVWAPRLLAAFCSYCRQSAAKDALTSD